MQRYAALSRIASRDFSHLYPLVVDDLDINAHSELKANSWYFDMNTLDPPLGTIVEVSVGRGVIRFSGATSFKPGKWVGIELYEPNGKNDGTVGGVTYFSCKMNYGVFVRASQIKATFGSERDVAPGPSTVRSVANNCLAFNSSNGT